MFPHWQPERESKPVHRFRFTIKAVYINLPFIYMSLDRSYMGWEISLAWPSAALLPDACKPSYEKWEAVGPNNQYVGGFTLAEIKRSIREHIK